VSPADVIYDNGGQQSGMAEVILEELKQDAGGEAIYGNPQDMTGSMKYTAVNWLIDLLRMVAPDGRLDLTLTPFVERVARTKLLVIRGLTVDRRMVRPSVLGQTTQLADASGQFLDYTEHRRVVCGTQRRLTVKTARSLSA
jgi:hypothetical protein